MQVITRDTRVSPVVLRKAKEYDSIAQQAHAATMQLRYKDAEVYARRLVALNSQDLMGWYYLARALDSQNLEKPARDAYAELLRRDDTRAASYQHEPYLLMRYAVLCFRANQWQQGETAAREAMQEFSRTDSNARKLPALPAGSLRPHVKQIEAMSHLLSGIGLMKEEGEKAGLSELDAAINSTNNDAIIAAANWQKWRAYGILGTTDPTNLSAYRVEGKKASQQVALHDRHLGFYKKYMSEVMAPAELKLNYGATPDRTYSSVAEPR